MTDATVTALTRLGWRIRDNASWTAAVEDFQRGMTLPGLAPLLVDGKAGRLTRAAVAVADERRRQGLGTASEHFSYAEWRCECGGRYAGCRLVVVHRPLLLGLEQYRAVVGGPVAIVSGYRCPTRNAQVHGATSSQHLWGAAADLDYALTPAAVARLRCFSGIGKSKSKGLVRHVDVRHLSGHNPTGGTPDRPTVWNYA